MISRARQCRTTTAAHEIRQKVCAHLNSLCPPIGLLNTVDHTSLSIDFQFIEQSVLGKGVVQADKDTIQGCQRCNVSHGGCETTGKCECLEFAPVDESRLTAEQRRRYQPDGDNDGLPKRFPYHSFGESARCLVQFYLDQRYVIFECNERCRCDRRCKSRVVQNGRTVPLTIFKTAGRGWGLKTAVPLLKGQFIDTYRGEILTNAAAEERERGTAEAEPSYMYTLDKFTDYLSEDETYIVDGRFVGGPIRFMNHSCDPNCRVFAVSYNKYDYRIYDLAMFACRPIAAGEELTFDYLDRGDEADRKDVAEKDGPVAAGDNETSPARGGRVNGIFSSASPSSSAFVGTSMSDRKLRRKGTGSVVRNGQPLDLGQKPHPKAVPCLCGASCCRRWLWT